MRVLEVEMHTQLNCRSEQTQKESACGKEQSPRAGAAPLTGTIGHQRSVGWQRPQDTKDLKLGVWGLPSVISPSPTQLWCRERGNLPFPGISTQGFPIALSLQARCLPLLSHCSWGHRGSVRDLGTATVAESRACSPSGAMGVPVTPSNVCHPSQAGGKSVPVRRTSKCRFPQFGRLSYTRLMLRVFPRFPTGTSYCSESKISPMRWMLWQGLRLFPT